MTDENILKRLDALERKLDNLEKKLEKVRKGENRIEQKYHRIRDFLNSSAFVAVEEAARRDPRRFEKYI